MDELLSRQRKEIRDLTSRITQKKKQATKKSRRGINDECESLERDLRARHAEEIASLEKPESTPEPELEPEDETAVQDPLIASTTTTTTTSATSSSTGTTSTSASTNTSTTSTDPPPLQLARRPNRQKARAARRAAELAALSIDDAESGASTLPNAREAEITAMCARLSELGLALKEIAPDGHCLYSAFADQLPDGAEAQEEGGEKLKGYRLARKRCADYMRAHREEFEPFLEGAFDEHVRKVEETAEWGGHAEILALARAFRVTVNVVQAQGRVERMNSEGGGDLPEVWLGYYRHSFGLGEHYNSLRRKDEE